MWTITNMEVRDAGGESEKKGKGEGRNGGWWVEKERDQRKGSENRRAGRGRNWRNKTWA